MHIKGDIIDSFLSLINLYFWFTHTHGLTEVFLKSFYVNLVWDRSSSDYDLNLNDRFPNEVFLNTVVRCGRYWKYNYLRFSLSSPFSQIANEHMLAALSWDLVAWRTFFILEDQEEENGWRNTSWNTSCDTILWHNYRKTLFFLSVSTGLCWFIFSLFRLYKAASEIYHHIAASLGKKRRRKEDVFKSAIW